jgi:hypothetical protein
MLAADMTGALNSFGEERANFLAMNFPSDGPAISWGTFLGHKRLFVAISTSCDRWRANARGCRREDIKEIVESVPLVDKQLPGRLSTAVLLVLVGGGLAACIVGALAHDVGRFLSAW